MLSYAQKEEERLAKEALEKDLRPLWLISYAIAKFKGDELSMSYDEFLKATLSTEETPVPKKIGRTAQEIEAELMQLVEIDKKKGG